MNTTDYIDQHAVHIDLKIQCPNTLWPSCATNLYSQLLNHCVKPAAHTYAQCLKASNRPWRSTHTTTTANNNNRIQKRNSRFFYITHMHSVSRQATDHGEAGILLLLLLLIAFKSPIQDFLQSHHCVTNHLQNVHSNGPGAISCANHVQHIEHISRAPRHVTSHTVRRDSSAIKFDKVYIAFIWALFYSLNINRWRLSHWH